MHLTATTALNYNYQGRHPPAQLAAMVATQNYNTVANSSTQWLVDSSCNSHITSDLSQLANTSNFANDEQIVVGSGQALPITHSGCGILLTPSSSLKLQELLCVPSISTNLVSVHRLCIDNNCILFV